MHIMNCCYYANNKNAQHSWQASIGIDHKDLGSIPRSQRFIYIIFIQWILRITLPGDHHTPSTSIHLIQRVIRSNAPSIRYHGTRASQRYTESGRSTWAQLLGPEIQMQTPRYNTCPFLFLSYFYFLIELFCLIIFSQKLITFFIKS